MIIGVVGAVAFAEDMISSAERTSANPVSAMLLSLLFAALGIYLLRGPDVKPQPHDNQPTRSSTPQQGVVVVDVETILNATGKSQAERIQELSNLRYQRLISDEEFQAAKTKILGI